MECWRRVWREGFAPQFTDDELAALAKGLTENDKRLVQGQTVVPPAVPGLENWLCEGACLIAYPLWKTLPANNTKDVQREFYELCARVKQSLPETQHFEHMIQFWDDTPRAEALKLMIAEVQREQARRRGEVVANDPG